MKPRAIVVVAGLFLRCFRLASACRQPGYRHGRIRKKPRFRNSPPEVEKNPSSRETTSSPEKSWKHSANVPCASASATDPCSHWKKPVISKPSITTTPPPEGNQSRSLRWPRGFSGLSPETCQDKRLCSKPRLRSLKSGELRSTLPWLTMEQPTSTFFRAWLTLRLTRARRHDSSEPGMASL